MESGKPNPGEMSPDQTLSVVNAMAERQIREADILQRMALEIVGPTYKIPTPEERAARLRGYTALLLVRVERPETQISLLDMVRANKDANSYQLEANKRATDDCVLDPKLMQTGAEDSATFVAAESGITPEYMADSFVRELAAAREVAAERGVPLEDVYADDDMYYESQRRAIPVEESLELGTKAINSMGEAFVTQILMSTLSAIIPKDEFDELDPLDKEEMDEMLNEMQFGPDFDAHIIETTDLMQEVPRQKILHSLVKTYGAGVVDTMTEDQKAVLMPRKPYATDLLEVML